jgi:Uma2 family endonuclease
MSAATPLPLSVEDYLHSSYSPDCDYVDGELQERNVGEVDHAEVQGALIQWFRNHGKEWNIRTLPEVRIQVSATRFRVADICLVSREGAPEPIVKRPPLAIIEVLSPEDRVSRYQQRLDDYRRMGVPNIRIVDPESRRGYDCSAGSWIETDSSAIDASPITVDLATIFAGL